MLESLLLPKRTITILELPAFWLLNDAELVVTALGGSDPLLIEQRLALPSVGGSGGSRRAMDGDK